MANVYNERLCLNYRNSQMTFEFKCHMAISNLMPRLGLLVKGVVDRMEKNQR